MNTTAPMENMTVTAQAANTANAVNAPNITRLKIGNTVRHRTIGTMNMRVKTRIDRFSKSRLLIGRVDGSSMTREVKKPVDEVIFMKRIIAKVIAKNIDTPKANLGGGFDPDWSKPIPKTVMKAMKMITNPVMNDRIFPELRRLLEILSGFSLTLARFVGFIAR